MNRHRKVDFKTAVATLRRVCPVISPYQAILSDELSYKAIIFPNSSKYYRLKAHIAESLLDAQMNQSKAELVCVPTEFNPEEWEHIGCWSFHSVSEYQNLSVTGIFYNENAIISPDGDLVVLVSQDGHALLGASAQFGEQIARRIVDLDDQRQAFAANWEHARRVGYDCRWVDSLLAQTDRGLKRGL